MSITIRITSDKEGKYFPKDTVHTLPNNLAGILIKRGAAVQLDVCSDNKAKISFAVILPEPFIQEIPESFYAPQLERAEEILSPAVSTDSDEMDMEEEEVEFDDTTPQG